MCYTPVEIEEEVIPFTVVIKGNFYYRCESGKCYKDARTIHEIYTVLTEATEAFENYNGDIEIQDANYSINNEI